LGGCGSLPIGKIGDTPGLETGLETCAMEEARRAVGFLLSRVGFASHVLAKPTRKRRKNNYFGSFTQDGAARLSWAIVLSPFQGFGLVARSKDGGGTGDLNDRVPGNVLRHSSA